ncbi:Mov34/MPN/PAD-1 family protein [Paenibacillus sp. CF384]|uniref:Mov34/MPN/PAD-1 family protein n=1 Tax=Paenibacillus sp. CF384 TaxID=1884382 RepID=UPI000895855B|nr:M67 family metallopeptidase [Paenibacillus sp. CF384]SDW53675.1 Proteasome lid subunit RPN8/RPN11, contains Jab1/MPN metalloenzyme (JAMM) motif [Paenibacillus sp. CF384]
MNEVTITSHAYQSLIEICLRALPEEACGILTGTGTIRRAQPPNVTVTGIQAIRNRSQQPHNRFAFDPKEWIQAYYSMQKNRQSLVGYFHSHPSTMPIPSTADWNGLHAAAHGINYWIVSLQQADKPLIQPYWAENGRFTPLMLTKISI